MRIKDVLRWGSKEIVKTIGYDPSVDLLITEAANMIYSGDLPEEVAKHYIKHGYNKELVFFIIKAAKILSKYRVQEESEL